MKIPKLAWFEWRHKQTLEFLQSQAWQLSIGLSKLDKFYNYLRFNPGFWKEFYKMSEQPTPLYFASRLSDELKMKIYLKRGDLSISSSYKSNLILAQLLLAKRVERNNIIIQANTLSYALSALELLSKFEFQFELFAEPDISEKLNVKEIEKINGILTTYEDTDIVKKWPRPSIEKWLKDDSKSLYIADSLNMANPYLSLMNDVASISGQDLKEQIKKETGQLMDFLFVPTIQNNCGYELFNQFMFDGIDLTAVKLDKLSKTRFAPNFYMETQIDKSDDFDLIREKIVNSDDAKEVSLWLEEKENISCSLASSAPLACLSSANIKEDSIVVIYLTEDSEENILKISKFAKG